MMGFFDKVKKALGSKKEDVESQNSGNNEVIDEPEPIESIGNDNENFNDNEEIQSIDSEETPVNEEIIDKPTPSEKIRNFKYLDELIHSGAKEIILDSDIVLSDDEESKYLQGIRLDVDDLTINGNGHAIDANGKARIFHCTGKSITIKNIILKNGFAQRDGGAICNEEGELAITGSALTANTAKYGGAICNEWGELTIDASTLTGNMALEQGGAIYNKNGGLTINDSALNNNATQGDAMGGAIINLKGELAITESAFAGNAADDGGAIYNNGSLTIKESALNNNTAKDHGGAIYNRGSFTIRESALAENAAEYGGAIYSRAELTVNASEFTKNTAQSSGGAIFNRNGELTVNASEFTENTAQSSGGAIYSRGSSTIHESIFSNNTTHGNGGAINKIGKLTISESALTGNNADEGGAIYNSGDELTITESTLNNNTAQEDGGAIYNHGQLIITESVMTGNSADEGGAICNRDELTITGSAMTGNAADAGGAICNRDELAITESALSGNTARKDGGAIHNGWGGVLTITASAFAENIADGNGVDIFNDGRIFSTENISKIMQMHNELGKFHHLKPLKNNQKDFTYLNELINAETREIKLENDIVLNIENNEQKTFEKGIEIDRDDLVIDGNGHAIDARGLARMFYCTGNNITIKNIILKNGYALWGGAIENREGELTVIESVITGNIAYNGGAIYNSEGELTVIGSSLTGNAAKRGGAIHDYGGELTVIGSTLQENTALSNGGAIDNAGGELTITESSFQENTANGKGGDIFNDGRIFSTENISNAIQIYNKGFGNFYHAEPLKNNQKDFKYLNELIHAETKEIKLENDIVLDIANNEHKEFEKGIEIDRDDLVIDGNGHAIDARGLVRIFYCTGNNITFKNIILKNGFAEWGGAIENREGELTVIESALTGNTAKYGGAIDNSEGELTVIGSALTGNNADEGGAIRDYRGELRVIESALTGNTAHWGGAIFLKESKKYESQNCTFRDNKHSDVYEEE